MQHEKRPRDEAGASAYGLADKRARLAPRVSFAAGTPWLPAFATPATLSKSRPSAAQASFLSTVSPAPRYGGARDVPSFTARARLPLASVPATLSKGSPAYADGYYAMSSAPQQPPQSTGFADSVQRAPTLLPSLPPAPLDRGFAASKLHHAEGASDDRQGYLNFVQLVQERRPDAAPQFVAWDSARRASEPALAGAAPSAAPTPAAAALACAMEKIAALQPRELALDRRLCHALEAMPREASRLREIEQLEAQAKRLAELRIAPAAADDAGLEDLTEEQLQLVADALGPGPPQVLANKSFKAFGELEVSRAHFRCMREGEWLNDEVINFYLGLLQDRELRLNAKQPRVHFHNTFFYNKLFADSREYNYKAVARWTMDKKLGYSIMDCDLVCVPVHQEVHWVLAVIDIKRREVRYYDSLGGVDRSCMANLLRYIVEEAKTKRDMTLDVAEWKQIPATNIPEQKNGCDCGVFMVKFADWLARQSDWTFSQNDMPYFRKRIIAEVRQLQAQ